MKEGATLDSVIQIIKPFVKNPAALEGANEKTSITDDLGVNSARLVDIVLEFEGSRAAEATIAADDNEAVHAVAPHLLHRASTNGRVQKLFAA